MRSASKKEKKLLDLDSRNRISLPKEICEGVDSFSWECEENGVIRLVPQQIVSSEDAELLGILKSSIKDFKSGRIKKISQKWLDNDDEKL